MFFVLVTPPGKIHTKQFQRHCRYMILFSPGEIDIYHLENPLGSHGRQIEMWYFPNCQPIGVILLFFGMLSLVVSVGCARFPYRYGENLCTQEDAALQPGEPQIERGQRAPVIDTVGWIFGIPSKILMFNHRVDNHDVSLETERGIQEYLANNDLDKVKVRVNQYDPLGEWRRLGSNKSVGWPARYTLGSLSCLGYTVLPGRLFGSDHYNPYTNTISLYSAVPAMALYQGGHAKDFAQREYKGWYSLAYDLPLINLWPNSIAANDAMGYLQDTAGTQDIKNGYRTVGPAFALSASRGLGSVGSVPVVLPAVLGGHLVGQVEAASYKETVPPDMPESEVVVTAAK
jgi:hypothetical protein